MGSIGFSFFRWSGISLNDLKFVGLQNYKTIFLHDPVFWRALLNNLIFVGGAIVFQCTLGLIVALLLEQRLLFGNFLRGTYFLPAVVSLTIIGIVFEILLNPELGVLKGLLGRIGLGYFANPSQWLSDKNKAIYVLLAIQVWYGFGWSMFIFVSGLKSINPELYEAAAMDGAIGAKKIVYITLPLLKGTYAVAILFATLWAVRVFELPFVITRGGPGHATEVLATWIYFKGFTYTKVGYGSALATILLIFGISLSFLIFRYTGMGKGE